MAELTIRISYKPQQTIFCLVMRASLQTNQLINACFGMVVEHQTSCHQLVSRYLTLIFSHVSAQEKVHLLEFQIGES